MNNVPKLDYVQSVERYIDWQEKINNAIEYGWFERMGEDEFYWDGGR